MDTAHRGRPRAEPHEPASLGFRVEADPQDAAGARFVPRASLMSMGAVGWATTLGEESPERRGDPRL